MSRRFIAIPFIAAVIALSSCGGDSGSPTATEPGEEATEATDTDLEGPAEDVEVIRSWAEALTESDIEAAAAFFAIPVRRRERPLLRHRDGEGRRVLQRVAPMRRRAGVHHGRGRVHHRHLRAHRAARGRAVPGQRKLGPDQLRHRGRRDRRMAPGGPSGRAIRRPDRVTRRPQSAWKLASSAARL